MVSCVSFNDDKNNNGVPDRVDDYISYLHFTDQLPTPKKKKGGIPGSLLLILILLLFIGLPLVCDFLGRVLCLITDGAWVGFDGSVTYF